MATRLIIKRLPLLLGLGALRRVSNQAARCSSRACGFERLQARGRVERVRTEQHSVPRSGLRQDRQAFVNGAAGWLSPRRLVAPRALRCGRSRRGWDGQRSRRRCGRSGGRAATIQEAAEAADLATLCCQAAEARVMTLTARRRRPGRSAQPLHRPPRRAQRTAERQQPESRQQLRPSLSGMRGARAQPKPPPLRPRR